MVTTVIINTCDETNLRDIGEVKDVIVNFSTNSKEYIQRIITFELLNIRSYTWVLKCNNDYKTTHIHALVHTHTHTI